jgi:hypothetical protein
MRMSHRMTVDTVWLTSVYLLVLLLLLTVVVRCGS